MDLWREEKLLPQRKDTVEPAAMTSMGAQVSVSPLTVQTDYSLVNLDDGFKCLLRLLVGN